MNRQSFQSFALCLVLVLCALLASCALLGGPPVEKGYMAGDRATYAAVNAWQTAVMDALERFRAGGTSNRIRLQVASAPSGQVVMHQEDLDLLNLLDSLAETRGQRAVLASWKLRLEEAEGKFGPPSTPVPGGGQ